ncbi:MAG: bacillithiol biosynthesis BshC [Acidobacteriota bacterium]
MLDPLRFLPPGTLPTGEPPTIDPTVRRSLADALAVANDAYGHPCARELADKLADPATRVIVTGQQPGLFGGALLALSKTVAAVRWAEALEASGVPAVAVFWVATEDHDWSESTTTTFLDQSGALTLDLGEDPSPLLPLGMRTLGGGLPAVVDQVRDILRGDEASGRLDQALAWYRPDARFGEAFSRLMIGILGDRAPLYLDSMLPALKTLQAPALRRLIERRAELDAGYRAADAAIEASGLPLQVHPQPGVSPLFLLQGPERRRIEWRGEDRFVLRGLDDEQPVERLFEILDENPSVISPGVLARPAIQDAVLGSFLQVMGPGEMSYLAQVAPTYRLLGFDAPWTSLRPQTLVLDARQARYLDELGLSVPDLLARPAETLVAERLGEDPVAPARERIAAVLAELRESVLALDANLEKPFGKTRDQIDRGLDAFSKKVSGSIARKNDVWLRRVQQTRDSLMPGGKLQERELSTLYLWGRHGQALVDAMFEQLDLDPRALRPVRLG